MPRRYTSFEPLLRPDPRFGSKLAAKIIHKVMWDGKKTLAQQIFYEALEIAGQRLPGTDPVEVFTRAIENVKPHLEVRSRRVGGATYQVPREVKKHRQQSLAVRWIVENARKKKGKPMSQRLAEEIVDAFNNTGASVTQKENLHKMAEANKAYSHFSWGR
jgi:small subunit ribosomal protein S7